MSYEILSALAAFAFVTSVTPGPNNLMLMASGANYGFVRTVPHMLGVGIGFTVMILLVGAGLVRVFETFPAFYGALKVVSMLYLSFLAWKIATAAPPGTGAASGRPMTFVQAALFQWVNPKAWAMALTAVTAYRPGEGLMAIALVAAIFGAINLPSVSAWTILGQQIRRFLNRPLRLRLFNALMAVLLLASLAPVIFA